jgi:beta-lactamase class A
MNNANSSKARLYVGVLGFVLGMAVCISLYFLFLNSHSPAQIKPLRESDLTHEHEFKFIDPLIGLSNTGTVNNPTYNGLRDQINSYIADEINKKDITAASVLFSDISEAAGFSLNPAEEYNPASLLKVPTMIAYYSLAEINPQVLNKRLTYSGTVDANAQENIISPVQLEKGQSYTVEELIEHMIKYSDNNAAELLIENLNNIGQSDVFNKVFRDMGITELDLSNDFITIRAYSLFFRVLYNSTYLGRSMSERSLGLLTQTDFTKGLDAGVPSGVAIAQKFGEFSVVNSRGSLQQRELHNCGIVYYPDHPYLLCVMTKGNDFKVLEGVISDISKQAYHFMDNKY